MIKTFFDRFKHSTRSLMALPLRAGLFALMFLAVLMIGTRLYDMIGQVVRGETPTAFTPAQAEEHADPAKADAKPDEKKAETKSEEKRPEEKKPEEKKSEEAKPEEKKEDAKPADAKPADAKPADAKPEEKKDGEPKPEEKKDDKKAEDKPAGDAAEAAPEVDDASMEEHDFSDSELTVLRHLSERRKALDKKGHELDQRETLMNLTEQRVDKKIADLKKMQEDIRKILGDADAAHVKQIASMVKIYETMKPKDAARIFETLDLPTLVEVASRMKEAKAAPVLAAMDSAKAKELSTALMTKKALPPAP